MDIAKNYKKTRNKLNINKNKKQKNQLTYVVNEIPSVFSEALDLSSSDCLKSSASIHGTCNSIRDRIY